MRHFAVQRFVRLTLYATLAHCALACSADDDRSPPIGAPTGPTEPVITGGGAFNGGSGGQPGANPNDGAANTGTNGGVFNLPGAAGASSFGATGGTGRDPFGIAGSGTAPFGIAGAASASAGTSFF
jgi:hypothetical protein